MKAILEGYLWVPVDYFPDLKKIKKELTFTPRKLGDSLPVPIRMYSEDREGYLGVPPYWGLCLDIDVEDKTTFGENFISECIKPDHNHKSVKDPERQKKFLKDLEFYATKCDPIFRAQAPTGTGKCLGKGTEVLLYNGKIKYVEDIVVGDKLMGPDSKPRLVTSICSGVDDLYRVIPKKGQSYVVNKDHILSLKVTKGVSRYNGPRSKILKDNSIRNIDIISYLQETNHFKHCTKGWRVGVDFQDQLKISYHLPPYILGLWLGDGVSRATGLTTSDELIFDSWKTHASNLGLFIREEKAGGKANTYFITSRRGNKTNEFMEILKKYNLINNKHIPYEYKITTRENRLLLLAGIIDTDGYRSGNNNYDIIFKNGQLANDVLFIARSLGFAAYMKPSIKSCQNNFKGLYYRISISGECHEIPVQLEHKKAKHREQKKDVLVTGIKVKPCGYGEYYGFTLDKDGLFLLGDFTVTHNTICAAWIAGGVLKSKTLILSHMLRLSQQWVETFRDILGVPEERIGIVDGTRKDWGNKDVVISTLQTIALNPGAMPDQFYREFGIIIVDEVHKAGAPVFCQAMWQFPAAARIGLSATHERKDGAHRVIENFLGPVAVRSDQAALPVRVYPVWYTARNRLWGDNHGSRMLCLSRDTARNRRIAGLIKKAYDGGRQGIIVSESIKHLELLMKLCEDIGIPKKAMGQFTATKNTMAKVKAGNRYQTVAKKKAQKASELERIKREAQLLFCSYGMIKEGVDIPRLDFGLAATPRTDGIQLIGRLRRPYEGKKEPVLWIDIVDKRCDRSLRYYKARLKDYDKCNADVIKLED